jgi:hypothetical protein
MRRFIVAARIPLLVMLIAAGFVKFAHGSSQTVSAPPVVVPREFKNHGRTGADAARSMKVTLRSIQQAYLMADWSALSQQFAVPTLSRIYSSMLRTWKDDAGGTLHVQLIASRPLGHGRYVGTVKFAGDPRAEPTYSVFVFSAGQHGMRIVSTASGLQGTTYRSASWAVSLTKHFVVYHSPYQLVGADRAGLRDLEFQRTEFARKFGVKLPPMTHYYLYPAQWLIPRLTDGVCGSNPDNVGCTLQHLDPPTIHTSEWVSFHEPIHVYQTVMEPHGYTAPLFIAEGMAVALEDRSVDPRLSDYCSEVAYVPLDECASYAINNVSPKSLLSDAGFGKADAGYAYSLAGSFVKYLILHYGYRSFAKFYYEIAAQPKDRVVDYEVATHHVFHTSIEHLLSAWTSRLCHGTCG